jgi:multidrug efflux pump subunit AcrA (membrane-fusion protein)
VNLVPTAGTLSYLARLELHNPGYVLRGGMLVTVTVTKARAVGAIVVPRSAVAQSPTGNLVYVVADNKAQAVPVKVGVQTDTMSQVISPKIAPGTMVITTRPDALKDGSVVAVSGAAPASSSASGTVH